MDETSLLYERIMREQRQRDVLSNRTPIEDKLNSLKYTQLRRQRERELILHQHPEMRMQIERLKHESNGLSLADVNLAPSPASAIGASRTGKCATSLFNHQQRLEPSLASPSIVHSVATHAAEIPKPLILYAAERAASSTGFNQLSTAPTSLVRVAHEHQVHPPRQTPVFNEQTVSVGTAASAAPKQIITSSRGGTAILTAATDHHRRHMRSHGRPATAEIIHVPATTASLANVAPQQDLHSIVLTPQYPQHHGYGSQQQQVQLVHVPSLPTATMERLPGFVRNVSLSSDTVSDGSIHQQPPTIETIAGSICHRTQVALGQELRSHLLLHQQQGHEQLLDAQAPCFPSSSSRLSAGYGQEIQRHPPMEVMTALQKAPTSAAALMQEQLSTAHFQQGKQRIEQQQTEQPRRTPVRSPVVQSHHDFRSVVEPVLQRLEFQTSQAAPEAQTPQTLCGAPMLPTDEADRIVTQTAVPPVEGGKPRVVSYTVTSTDETMPDAADESDDSDRSQEQRLQDDTGDGRGEGKARGSDDGDDPNHNRHKNKKKKTTGRTGLRKDPQWLKMHERLKDYKEEHGDCIVPRGYPPSPVLASWVAEQRYV